MNPTLRERAEAAQQLRPETPAPTSVGVHELQVHQIELELQNEELRRTQAELEVARERYFDLYDLAPIGYLTVSDAGLIVEANLTAANLLGVARGALAGKPLTRFFSQEGADTCYRLLQQIRADGKAQTCELHLTRPDGSAFWAQLRIAPDVKGAAAGRIVLSDDTEHRQAKAALEASAAKHRAVIEFAVDGILLGSPEGKITGANSRMLQLAGQTLEQLLGRHIQELFSAQELSAKPLQFAQLMQGQTVVNVRHLLHPDGTTVPVESHSKMMPDGTFQSIFRDISERAEREQTMAFLARTSSGTATEPFFRMLARYLAQDLDMDFVCIDRLEGDGLTAQTVAVWCDGQFEDNVTYSLKDTPCGDVVGKTVCCFPASVSKFFPRDQVLQDLRAESYVGTTLWSHKGQPIGLIALISRRPLAKRAQAEATLKMVAERAAGELERQQAEAALRLNAERHQAILQTAMDGFWLANTQGQLLEANEAYCRMSGYSTAELLTMRIADFEANESPAEVLANMERLKTQGQLRFETKHRRKDGSIFDVEVSAQYQPTEGGRTVAFLRDITERKQAAAALQEKLVELERMNRLMVGRENRMIELKREINELSQQLNLPKRYSAPDTTTPESKP